MWGYYGSKSKIVNKYPKPEFGKIIEPFAGTAQYSLKYFDRDVLLIEKYDVIVKLWKWLQQCSKQDVLGLPRLKHGENVDNFTWDCEEAKWLVGFIIAGAPSQPKKTASKWKTVIRPNTQDYKLNMIAENLYKIKHWVIKQGDYIDLANEKATWFIDPPYQFGGEYYKFGNKSIDFVQMGDWCKSRFGQVIVCENSKADWLDFKPLVEMRGNKFKTTECMYLVAPNFNRITL
jgi:site-specific DNA-adenine methylase